VILDCIEKDHCLIIKNDFLHQNDDYLWWNDYWCKDTYYKKKHDAVDNFLFMI
jgi:hypothetical protein